MSIEKSKHELEKELVQIRKKIRKLESEIPREESKLRRSMEIEKEIGLIQNQYEEELGSSKEIKIELDSLHDYKRTQKELEKRIRKLKTFQYSDTILSFEKDVNKLCTLKETLEEEIILPEGEEGDEEEGKNFCEETIRSDIHDQEQFQKELIRLEECLNQLYLETESSEKELEHVRETHLQKYKNISIVEEIDQCIEQEKEAIVSWKTKQMKYQDNLTQIEQYEKYCESNTKYEEWVGKHKHLQKEEKEKRERYDASKIMADKILQAESISIMNIVESINTHAQVYLDAFFPDEPICVQITPFKENKKKKQSKPQLTILIEYKGMECDTGMLSGGELARVTMAYTLALAEMFNSSLLMLDESTSNLDQGLTHTVFQSIRENFNGKLVVVVAHQVVTGTFDHILKLI
jgi:DNA repair exonuclease SbcCD ATPase subunit